MEYFLILHPVVQIVLIIAATVAFLVGAYLLWLLLMSL